MWALYSVYKDTSMQIRYLETWNYVDAVGHFLSDKNDGN